MTYDTLQSVGGSEQTLATWGFSLSSCQGEKRTQSIDTWRGAIVNTPAQNNPIFNFEQQVIIRSGRVSATGLANSFSGGVTKFVGVRVLVPTKGDSSGPGFTYEFQGGRYFLDNIQYKQQYASTVGACLPAEVILFTEATLSGPGNDLSTWKNISPGQQIADIVNYAIAVVQSQQGYAFCQLGTIDAGLTQCIFPSLICKPMTCSAAIDKCLEMFPRVNEVWDYTTTPPTVSFRQIQNLAPVTLPLFDATNHKSIKVTRRDDLLARAVMIVYRITATQNGTPVVSYAIDQWGPIMEAAYQAAGGDGNRLAGNNAAQAVSAQTVYINAVEAYLAAHPNQYAAAYLAGDNAVNAAVAANTCDPREGLRVPSQLIDLAGEKTTTATAFMDCEPVLCCLSGNQAAVRQWWSEHRGGGVSELGNTKIRFQDSSAVKYGSGGLANVNATSKTIPVATLSSGDLTGVSINNPGSGYNSGDTLTLTGGTLSVDSPNPNGSPATILVQQVDGNGAILSVSIGDGGYYSAYPASPNAAHYTAGSGAGGTNGTGFGATFNLSFLTLAELLAIYPNRIVRGTHHSWMTYNSNPVYSIKVRARAVMQYNQYDVIAQYPDDGVSPNPVTADTALNGNCLENNNAKEHHCDLELTNGITGTYSTLKSDVAGEVYIIGVSSVAIYGVGYNGIARTLYLALAQYQYDGDYVKVETSFTNGVTLNNTLNLSGGNAAWATMKAQITGIREDYGTHVTSVQVGPSKHLSAQQMSSLLNMWRLRQPWFNPAVKDDNTQLTNGGDIGLPVTAGNANTTQGTENQSQTQHVTYNS